MVSAAAVCVQPSQPSVAPFVAYLLVFALCFAVVSLFVVSCSLLLSVPSAFFQPPPVISGQFLDIKKNARAKCDVSSWYISANLLSAHVLLEVRHFLVLWQLLFSISLILSCGGMHAAKYFKNHRGPQQSSYAHHVSCFALMPFAFLLF